MKIMRKVLAILIVAITVFSTSICAFAAGGQFTIVFNSNGGSGTMSNQKVTYGTTTTVNTNQFTRSGYIFRGWNVKRADGTWNIEKLHGGDAKWSKSVDTGYHKTLYKNNEKVAKTAPAGTKVTFYAVWEGSNDKFSTFNCVNIKETNKNISSDSNRNPFLKKDNNFWCVNTKSGYPSSLKTKGTGYYTGAVALAIIDNMLYGSYDKSLNKYHDGDKTKFSSVGYTYSANISSYQDFLQAIYDQIVRGYPVPIKVKESSGHEIYAVAYAVLSNKGRPNGKLIANDIAIIDTYSGSWKRLDEMYKYTPNGKYEMGIHSWNTNNLYTRGEESYRFENYPDNDSQGGHCFGMSITSSGYYHGYLDIKNVSATAALVYNLSENSTVKSPICLYQSIQGSCSTNAIVAGGCYYKNNYYDIDSDWKSVVAYVKNNDYNYKGSLQIGFRGIQGKTSDGKDISGGHAINFLYYKVVNGQERIYAYDNNFPEKEVYFYKDSKGVHEAPNSTFPVKITCICLRDVHKYFKLSNNYDAAKCIYADDGELCVVGDPNIKKYYLDGDIDVGEHIVYEVSENANWVTVTPSSENANISFTYLSKEYNFDDETGGAITINFSQSNPPDDGVPEPIDPPKEGFFAWLKSIIHKLIGWINS